MKSVYIENHFHAFFCDLVDRVVLDQKTSQSHFMISDAAFQIFMNLRQSLKQSNCPLIGSIIWFNLKRGFWDRLKPDRFYRIKSLKSV